MIIQKQENRRLLNLFDAWDDAVRIFIEWQETNEIPNFNNNRTKTYMVSPEDKKKIETHLTLINEYDLQPALDEIESNLLSLEQEDREYFIKTILYEFTPLYAFFSPKFGDKNEFNPSEEIHYLISGKNIVNSIWNLYENSQKIPENFLSQYIVRCCCLLWNFIERVDIICIGLKIDIEYIQDKYGIRVRQERNYNRLLIEGGFSFDYIHKVEKEYCDMDENNSIDIPEKEPQEVKPFKDYFKSSDAYEHAMSELEKLGYVVNGEIKIEQKVDFIRIISSLWIYGYMKKIKMYTGDEFEKIGKSLNFPITGKHANNHKESKEKDVTIKMKPYHLN